MCVCVCVYYLHDTFGTACFISPFLFMQLFSAVSLLRHSLSVLPLLCLLTQQISELVCL